MEHASDEPGSAADCAPIEHIRTVGFIGLGQMGAPIARRLRQAQIPLLVFDTRPTAVDEFVREGAVAVESPKALADRTDAIFSCLPSPAAVMSCALGSDGVEAGTRPLTYVELSSIGPKATREVAARLIRAGKHVVDSPCTGGARLAATGDLALMVAGHPAVLAPVMPLLRQIAGFVERVGDDPGDGQVAKLVNNAIALTTAAVTAEALVLGAKAGLDQAALLRVINHGSGRSEMSSRRFVESVLPRKFNSGAFLPNGLKDFDLFLSVAGELGVRAPVVAAAAEVRRLAVEMLGPRADSSEEIKIYERWAGLTLDPG